MAEIRFVAHNHRVKFENFDPEPLDLSHRPRGWVGGFSKFSRQRLMELLYSFEKIPFRTFWTLTFEKDVDSDYAKKELHRLTMVFNRRGIGWMWVMEFTQKGRIHFHLGVVGYLSKKWVAGLWGNGFVHVEEIYDDDGAREYFLKQEKATFYGEVSKGNQKRFNGFNGRWWGVSRFLNKKYSLGVYDESFLRAVVDIRGVKRAYFRKDFEGILDKPYENCNNFNVVKRLNEKGKQITCSTSNQKTLPPPSRPPAKGRTMNSPSNSKG